MEQQVAVLRKLSARLGVPPLRAVAKLPGVKEVYRITVYYAARRVPDTVSTLTLDRYSQITLNSVYLGLFGHKAITKGIAPQSFEEFRRGLIMLRFDHLADQPDIPLHDVDLWLVERAANGFEKSVLIVPLNAQDRYARIVELVHQWLPEAIRELRG